VDAATLVKAMPGLSLERAKHLVDGCNQAMVRGEITTRLRAAMFLAQVGHESISLRHKRELGSGQRYAPYIGRTFIQITWKSNYLNFGHWVGVGDQFVRDPSSLEDDRWAWLGPVWFWTTHDLNRHADRGDVRGATKVINGGLNGLADRQARYQRCVNLGDAILPTKAGPPREDDMTTDELLDALESNRGTAILRSIIAAELATVIRGDKDTPDGGTHPHNLRSINVTVREIKDKLPG
jgi:predicted chitinase